MTQALYVMMRKPEQTGAIRLNKAQSAALRKHIKFPSSVTKRTKARVSHRARNITRRKKARTAQRARNITRRKKKKK